MYSEFVDTHQTAITNIEHCSFYRPKSALVLDKDYC